MQLLRLLPAVREHDVVVTCNHSDYGKKIPGARFRWVPDASLDSKWRLGLQATMVALWVLRERPDVVLSTGASSGYFALRMGKRLGAKTVWVDSLANVEQLSVSGTRVEPYADLWLTQWKHLARPAGPGFRGAVL